MWEEIIIIKVEEILVNCVCIKGIGWMCDGFYFII